MGETDGQPKDARLGGAHLAASTPETIRKLARRMAATRTFITVTWSLQRADHGEQPIWMAVVLAAMLGQIGLPGGGFGFGYGSMDGMGAGALAGARPLSRRAAATRSSTVHPGRAHLRHAAAIRAGPSTTTASASPFPTSSWSTGAAAIRSTIIRTSTGCVQAWRRPETIIVHELCWTPTARHADIVLPATTTLERNDIGVRRATAT